MLHGKVKMMVWEWKSYVDKNWKTGGLEADGRYKGCLQVSEKKDDERDLQSTFQQAHSSECTGSSEFTH